MDSFIPTPVHALKSTIQYWPQEDYGGMEYSSWGWSRKMRVPYRSEEVEVVHNFSVHLL